MANCAICKRTMESPVDVNSRMYPQKHVSTLVWFAEITDSACNACLMTAAAMVLVDPKKRKEVAKISIERDVDMKKKGVENIGQEQEYLRERGLLIKV